ncbi:MAG: hypothetical protein LBS19_04745 [Clostridiales bacterium]|nr:hypothetical protein [Clostridiales bacterium]
MPTDIKEIPQKTFTYNFKDSEKNHRRYCFILGSGASREAGILTGVEMARIWAEEIKKKYDENDLDEIMDKLGIKDIKGIEPNSKNYFNLYDICYRWLSPMKASRILST